MTTNESIIKAIKDAYEHVETAPDSSLSPREAWLVGAAYVAEFTCRELFKQGVIEREEAVPVFHATGGCKGDIYGWKEPTNEPD